MTLLQLSVLVAVSCRLFQGVVSSQLLNLASLKSVDQGWSTQV